MTEAKDGRPQLPDIIGDLSDKLRAFVHRQDGALFIPRDRVQWCHLVAQELELVVSIGLVLPILLSAGLVAFQRLAHYRVEVLRWLDLDNACSVLNARVSLVGDVAGRGIGSVAYTGSGRGGFPRPLLTLTSGRFTPPV
jgi:hypothetical protein